MRNKEKSRESIKKLTLAGLCLALCLLLPFVTGQIPTIGSALAPMHIPVLLAGFICGWQYGLLVGFIAPTIRFLLFGMPPLFPVGIAMSFELATYGLVTGLLYKKLAKNTLNIYIALIGAMLTGRVVWGVVSAALAGVSKANFGLEAFIAGAFINAIPGIICHIIIIPVIVMIIKKAGILTHETIEGHSTTAF